MCYVIDFQFGLVVFALSQVQTAINMEQPNIVVLGQSRATSLAEVNELTGESNRVEGRAVFSHNGQFIAAKTTNGMTIWSRSGKRLSSFAFGEEYPHVFQNEIFVGAGSGAQLPDRVYSRDDEWREIRFGRVNWPSSSVSQFDLMHIILTRNGRMLAVLDRVYEEKRVYPVDVDDNKSKPDRFDEVIRIPKHSTVRWVDERGNIVRTFRSATADEPSTVVMNESRDQIVYSDGLNLRLFNPTKNSDALLACEKGRLLSGEYSSDSAWFVVVLNTEIVELWQARERKMIRRWSGVDACFDDSGSRVCVVSLNGVASLFDIRSGAPLWRTNDSDCKVRWCDIAKDGKSTVTVYENGKAVIWPILAAVDK